jgi:short-chain fatty acids transporter
MIRAMGAFFSGISRRFLPDAFIFALVLVILTFVLGIVIQGASVTDMATYFGEGFWDFLVFSMQMVLILVTGSALATSRPVHRILRSIARRTRTPAEAIVLATIAMMVGCWINWGFGLIVSALLARELARNVRGVHYPLLVASAYSGFIVWHAGLSASIPLKIAGPDAIMERVAVFLVVVPIINRLMSPRDVGSGSGAGPSLCGGEEAMGPVKREHDARQEHAATPAERLENSRLLSMLFGVLAVFYIVRYFIGGGRIDFNIVNFIFLTAGIMLHGTPIRYVRAINEAVKTCGGIVLQFPLYAGIMGMMIHSGLAVTFSQGFVDISNASTFPFFTYLSAGIVNIFVPSGGGQWAVQGPIMIPAAKTLGVPYATTAMAIAWGDAWTNLIQPFWALPLLAVAKLGVRDIMGYTAVILLFSGVITGLFMLFVF